MQSGVVQGTTSHYVARLAELVGYPQPFFSAGEEGDSRLFSRDKAAAVASQCIQCRGQGLCHVNNRETRNE
jgi:hypothetical protein